MKIQNTAHYIKKLYRYCIIYVLHVYTIYNIKMQNVLQKTWNLEIIIRP